MADPEGSAGTGGISSVRKFFRGLFSDASPIIFWTLMVLVVGPILVLVYTAILRVFVYLVLHVFDPIPLKYARWVVYLVLALGIVGAVVTIIEMWKSTRESS